MPENDVKLTKLAKCAGCGAKVGAGVLAQLLDGIQVHRDPNLLVGFDKSDDASVYKVSDDLALVQTVDFFPPIADDPYLFGQIAATNALSDVYAMGGRAQAVPEHHGRARSPCRKRRCTSCCEAAMTRCMRRGRSSPGGPQHPGRRAQVRPGGHRASSIRTGC